MIKVGAISEVEMLEKATKSAIAEGVIAGGGVALVKAKPALNKLIDSMDGDERVGALVVLKAIEEPLRQIAKNAGVDDGVVLRAVEQGGVNHGYDASKDVYCDMFDAGIIDPVRVTRTALETAASVASTLLTTECVVAIADQKFPPSDQM